MNTIRLGFRRAALAALALTAAFAAAQNQPAQQGAPQRRQATSPPPQTLEPQQQREDTGNIQQQLQQTGNNIRRAPAKPKARPQPAKLDKTAGHLALSKPAHHANLTVYLIEAADRLDTTAFLTLDEALEKGLVKVIETGDVNELKIKNTGKQKSVFIMAGDIVKGGKQDRTLSFDLTLGPASGEVPISSFCVEQGRWQARGGESVAAFSSSKNAIVGNSGKLAVRSSKAQGEVWEEVAKAQKKISASIAKPVTQNASPSSLQLALEDTDLKKKSADYAKAMKPLIEENDKAVGYVAVINGSVYSAEIFAGHDLFRRAWPKLIETTAIEAISEKDAKPAATAATPGDVKDFLTRAEDAAAEEENVFEQQWSVSAISKKTALFQTVDKANDGRWLRRSLLAK